MRLLVGLAAAAPTATVITRLLCFGELSLALSTGAVVVVPSPVSPCRRPGPGARLGARPGAGPGPGPLTLRPGVGAIVLGGPFLVIRVNHSFPKIGIMLGYRLERGLDVSVT